MSPFFFLAAIFWIPVSLAAAGHAALKKRDPRAAAMWMTISVFLPLVGPLAYFVVGRRRS